MSDTLQKFTSIAISLMLLLPNTVGAAVQNASQQEVAKIITSAESPADKSGMKEISLSVVSAMVLSEDLPRLQSLTQTGHDNALKEFRAEYTKWFNLISDDPKGMQIACKNAKEILIRKYKQELEALWPRRYILTHAEREQRVLLESKLFTLENIRLSEGKTIVVDTAIKNTKLISNLTADIMGREYVENISLQIAKSIDISGPHGYMGHSINSIRETVVYFLNDIVKTTRRAMHGSTLDKRLLNAAASENSVKVLARTITSREGQNAFYDFLNLLQYRLTRGGATLGIAGGAVIGIGLLFMTSSHASAHNISNSRLAISRELNATLNATPSLLSTKIITLKQVYGAPLVASVIAENSATMLPLVKQQFAAMQKPEVKAGAEYIFKEATAGTARLNAAKEAEFKRKQVITAVQDNTYVKTFNEKMKPLKLK